MDQLDITKTVQHFAHKIIEFMFKKDSDRTIKTKPLLKHACGESDWLPCWPQTPGVNLRECISRAPLPGVNKAAQSGFET